MKQEDISKWAIQQRAERRRRIQEAEEAQKEQARQREAAIQAAFVKARRPQPSNEDPFFRTIDKRASRLMDDVAYENAVGRLRAHIRKVDPVRDITDWMPRGKGRETLFRSLGEHLLAKYPVPAFLWNAFFEDEWQNLIPFVSHIAGGGGLIELVKNGSLTVPLTRRMCHDLMQTTSEHGVLYAIRRIQVRTAGGDTRLLNALMATPAGRILKGAEEEAFWATVLDWMGRAAMLNPLQIGPLVDFIAHRRRQDATFNMKGRTALSLLRDMDAWHGDLAKEKAIHGYVFKPSGFKPGLFDKTKNNHHGVRETAVWTVKEVLTSKHLMEEGRVLRHCVYSYARSIESGTISIWSICLNDERQVTLEVRNGTNAIVQARGFCNRAPNMYEYKAMSDWAQQNNLTLATRW